MLFNAGVVMRIFGGLVIHNENECTEASLSSLSKRDRTFYTLQAKREYLKKVERNKKEIDLARARSADLLCSMR